MRVLHVEASMERDLRIQARRHRGRLLAHIDPHPFTEHLAERTDLALQDRRVADVQRDRVDDEDPQEAVPLGMRCPSIPNAVRVSFFAATSSRMARFFAIASGRLYPRP